MKPQKMCVIKQGKAIGSDEHKGFADTFNWLVRFCKNLRGDGLFIEVDNKFGDIPTITFKPTVPVGGGGGPTYKPYPQPFDFTYKEITTTTTDPVTGEEVETTTYEPYITNNFFYVGRAYQYMPDKKVESDGTYFVKLTTNNQGAISQLTWEIGSYDPSAIGFGPGNGDTYTYFPVWKIEDVDGQFVPTFDYRAMWKLPFYSV